MEKPTARRVAQRLDDLQEAAVGRAVTFLGHRQKPVRVLATGFTFAVCLAALLAYHRAQFNMLVYADALDNAQVARNIAAGRGFTTSFLRPSGLALNKNLTRPPELRRPPLGPLVEGLLFALSKPTDRVASYYSATFYLLTLMSLYGLASSLFGWQVGCLTVIALGLNRSFLGAAVSGLPLTLATWLFTLLCGRLWRHHRRFSAQTLQRAALAAREAKTEPPPAPTLRQRASHAFWIGVLLGLCSLTYYALLAAVPVAFVYVLCIHPERRRFAPAAAFLCGFLICFGPLLLRNYRVTGTPGLGLAPLELSMFTEYFPGYTLHRQVGPVPGTGLGFAFLHPKAMARKLIREGLSLYTRVPDLATPPLFGLFLVSLFYRDEERRAYRLIRAFVCFTFALTLVGVCAVHANPQLFVVFLPVLTLGGIEFLRYLGEELVTELRLGRWRVPREVVDAGVTAAVLLFVAAPSLAAITIGQRPPPNPSRPSFEILAKKCAKKNSIVTDAPWSVAWYTGRQAIWFPLDPGSLADLPPGPGKRWLYLSRMLPTYPAAEARPWLSAITGRQTTRRFGNAERLPNGELLMQCR